MPLRVASSSCCWRGRSGSSWIVALFIGSRPSADNVYSVLQGIEAAANLIVLMGAGVFFLSRIEERLKRRGALKALHELRSIVHVIDMHQLTKDPSAVVSIAGKTASSPARTLSRIEVTRYLDYCSEMLSLTSKVAVLFAQGFPDPPSPRRSATSSASPPACRKRSGRRSTSWRRWGRRGLGSRQ